MRRKAIVWFRNDLRISDNVTLYTAIQNAEIVYPVYCFDPRQYEETAIGLPKTGSFRAKFILETVENLRANLRLIGAELIIRQGLPEKIIPQLAAELGATVVYASKEVTSEEIAVERQLEEKLLPERILFEMKWQSTLFHIDDIPWPIKSLPDTFSGFRKEAEGSTQVRESFPPPAEMHSFSDIHGGEIPAMDELGLMEPPQDSRRAVTFTGGESEGMKRLRYYLWEKDLIKTYKETRNEMLGDGYSSKFSAWLAVGALSPRVIYEEVKKYEQERIRNKSTYWLIFELLWRDYFRFVAKKYANRLFQVDGIQGKGIEYHNDIATFKRWKLGETGVPFIDANMRELNASGYMSNRGRQNVASFLIKDLKVNWTWGASYFESLLVDYDVCSNWCNWNYVAGVGNDPREDRYFNIISQAKRYDPQGDFVRHWIPELSEISGKQVHYPGKVQAEYLQQAGVSLGRDYPKPMVNFDKWMY